MATKRPPARKADDQKGDMGVGAKGKKMVVDLDNDGMAKGGMARRQAPMKKPVAPPRPMPAMPAPMGFAGGGMVRRGYGAARGAKKGC